MWQAKRLCGSSLACVLSALLWGCGGGPSAGEFVDACLQGQMGGERLSREQCECAAQEAKSGLSSDGYKVMVADMQNNQPEVEKIKASMSDDEQMEMMRGTAEVVGKCIVNGAD